MTSNPPLIPLPIAGLFVATAIIDQPTPTSTTGALLQYGALGIITALMVGAVVWQEKQRRRRDDADRLERQEREKEERVERAEYLTALERVISQKDAIIAEKDKWIMERAEKGE